MHFVELLRPERCRSWNPKCETARKNTQKIPTKKCANVGRASYSYMLQNLAESCQSRSKKKEENCQTCEHKAPPRRRRTCRTWSGTPSAPASGPGPPSCKFFANFWRARSRLYRHRSSHLTTRFSAFFEIYKII